MCFAPIARARSAWRRRGMSRDPSLEQGIADPLDMTYHGGVSYHGGYYGRCIKYAAGGSPNAPERDDSPKAMFRKMDGAALGSGAAAGAEAVLPGGDACSSSLTRSIRPPAASTGELRSLSTTRTVAVGPAGPQRTDGIQVAAVVREVALPVDGRERRPSTLLGTHYALELKRRESQGRLKLEATGRQQAMRQAAAIAAARGRAMEGDRCGSPQVFRESSGKQAEICGLGVREAARSQGMKAISALWPEVQARADLLAPQILQELTDAAQQPYRSPSPLHSVANQTPPRPRTRSKTRDARDPTRPCGVRLVHWGTFVDRTTRSGLSSKMQSRRRSSPTRAAESTSLSTYFLSMTVISWSCQRWQKKLLAALNSCGSRWRSFRGRAVSVADCLEARCS